MKGFRSCEEYIGFDDRKYMIGGILLISIGLFPIICGMDPYLYYEHFVHEFPESLFYTTFFWTIFRYLIIKMRKKYPKIEDTRRRIILLVLITLIFSPIAGKLIGTFVQTGMSILGIVDHIHPSFIQQVVVTYVLSVGVFAIYEAIYYFLKYKQAIQEKERLQTVNVQSELDNLRNQINPHFLFNSLNTVMNIIPKDPERAMAYLNKLSKFYRYSVGKHEESLVSLEAEIENAKLYSDLLHERFGDNINIDFRNGYAPNTKVVPLSLQLLIENAVKHNIVSKKNPLKVDVFISDDKKYIHVKNNLQKRIQEVSSTRVGLDNITKRFAYLTDDNVKIEQSNEHFEVAIPLVIKAKQ